MRNDPPGVTTRATLISLRVSVPVLSVQITVTDPSVSTLGRRRTIALCVAMRRTPMASAIVTIAGRPSGIAATASPTTARKVSAKSRPRSTPTPSSTAPAATITAVSTRPKCASLRVSGVSRASMSAMSVVMRPISARAPVATTTARARPRVTSVPAYAIDVRSASGAAASTAASSLPTGIDSPVSAASSVLKSCASMSRTSAGTRSPDSRCTTSPGTMSSASSVRRMPSRTTAAVGVSMLRIAASACSARPSCTTPMIALMTVTPKITAASRACPSSSTTPPEASST